MVAHTWHGIILVIMALSLLMGCASSPYVGTGAVLGGGLGALAGAAIGNRNPWAGAAIGGLVGTALGAGGGYMVQQRQTTQPPQGYYYPSQPGYGAPAPYGYSHPAPGPAYGYNTPAPATPPGPRYSGNAPAPATPPGPGRSWNTPAPVTPSEPGYGNNSVPQAYSQAPQPSNARTPITPAPYNYQQTVE